MYMVPANSTIALLVQSASTTTATYIPTAALAIVCVCVLIVMAATTRFTRMSGGVGLTDYLQRRRYRAHEDNESKRNGSKASLSESDSSDKGIYSGDEDDDECIIEQQRERDSFRDSSHHRILKNSNGNKVVARILPRNDIEYELHKPNAQRSKATEDLRIALETHLQQNQDSLLDKLTVDPKLKNADTTKNPVMRSECNDEDLLVTLHVDATVPSANANTPEARFRFHMNMQ